MISSITQSQVHKGAHVKPLPQVIIPPTVQTDELERRLNPTEQNLLEEMLRSIAKGNRKPSLRALAKTIGVASTNTVRKAQDEIVARGRLVRLNDGGFERPESVGIAFTLYFAYDALPTDSVLLAWSGMARLDSRIFRFRKLADIVLVRICYTEKTALQLPKGTVLAIRKDAARTPAELARYRRPRWFLVRLKGFNCVRLLRAKRDRSNNNLQLEISADAKDWEASYDYQSGMHDDLHVEGLIEGIMAPATNLLLGSLRSHLLKTDHDDPTSLLPVEKVRQSDSYHITRKVAGGYETETGGRGKKPTFVKAKTLKLARAKK